MSTPVEIKPNPEANSPTRSGYSETQRRNHFELRVFLAVVAAGLCIYGSLTAASELNAPICLSGIFIFPTLAGGYVYLVNRRYERETTQSANRPR